MKCLDCNVNMRTERVSNAAPYQFERCGLDNVYLVGIEVETCPQCGGIYPIIPKMQELHRAITSVLINKSMPLSGQEIRYLRRWMGVQSQEFASLLGFGPEHLSKVENDRVQLGAAGDRLVRVYAMTKRDRLAFEDICERLDKVKRIKGSRARVHRRCHLQGENWKVETQAA